MIAIHHHTGSFSEKWIEYCDRNSVPYKIVNCFDSDIIDQLSDCEGVLWHWHHNDHRAIQFARQLIYSLDMKGIQVFPNTKTIWHFDDKVGQKYLLESLKIPLVKSFVFYEKWNALRWARNTTFPVVFKLRSGAGAENVKLVKSYRQASVIIKKAFSGGFKSRRRTHSLKERYWHWKRDKSLITFLNIAKGIVRVFIPKDSESSLSREQSYTYFQEFIENNDSDVRVVVIGKRAFGIKRMIRKGDFRASGSGVIEYSIDKIPLECVSQAFDYSKRIGAQSLAFDYIFQNGKPLVVEVSYCFAQGGYVPCPGYWTESMDFVSGTFTPEWFILEDLLKEIDKSHA